MTEKNKVFFAADGITATSANHLCNIGKDIHKEDFIPYSMSYQYGHVIVHSDMCIQIVYRIWVR